jgi:hypothetical protein
MSRNKCFFSTLIYHMFYAFYPFVSYLLILPRNCDVFTVVIVSWVVIPCVLVGEYQCFGGKCCNNCHFDPEGAGNIFLREVVMYHTVPQSR